MALPTREQVLALDIGASGQPWVLIAATTAVTPDQLVFQAEPVFAPTTGIVAPSFDKTKGMFALSLG